MQFGVNEHLKILQRLLTALTPQGVVILLSIKNLFVLINTKLH